VKLTDLDLNKLSVFLVVADSGGVGKAAKRLGRTSSAVSQSISGLETALGAPLFDRVGKRLVLTRGGQTLRERVAASSCWNKA
jgi:DNA-binding transcriptional LysR family regulator